MEHIINNINRSEEINSETKKVITELLKKLFLTKKYHNLEEEIEKSKTYQELKSLLYDYSKEIYYNLSGENIEDLEDEVYDLERKIDDLEDEIDDLENKSIHFNNPDFTKTMNGTRVLELIMTYGDNINPDELEEFILLKNGGKSTILYRC